ncbi:MAG: hypothetical protein ABR555_05225 [Pyrinomonadaceae bacterium]
MIRNEWFQAAAIAVTLALLCACRHQGVDQNWQEIPSLEIGEKKLSAGKLIRLEPKVGNPVQMSGSQMTYEKFKFLGTLLDPRSDLDVKRTVTADFVGADEHGLVKDKQRSVTEAGEPMKWMKSESRRDIEFTFAVPPVIAPPVASALSGKGFLYFYLTDLNGNCVSNIVASPVTLR